MNREVILEFKPILNRRYEYVVSIQNKNIIEKGIRNIETSYDFSMEAIKKSSENHIIKIEKKNMKYEGFRNKEIVFLSELVDTIMNPVNYKINKEIEVSRIENLDELKEDFELVKKYAWYSDLDEDDIEEFLKGIKKMFSSPRLVTDYIAGRDLSIFLFVPFYEKYNFNNIVRRKVKLRNIGGIDLPLRLESKLVEAHVGKDLISLEITGKLDDVYFDKNKSIKKLEDIFGRELKKIKEEFSFCQKIDFSLKTGVIKKNITEVELKFLENEISIYENNFKVNLEMRECDE